MWQQTQSCAGGKPGKASNQILCQCHLIKAGTQRCSEGMERVSYDRKRQQFMHKNKGLGLLQEAASEGRSLGRVSLLMAHVLQRSGQIHSERAAVCAAPASPGLELTDSRVLILSRDRNPDAILWWTNHVGRKGQQRTPQRPSCSKDAMFGFCNKTFQGFFPSCLQEILIPKHENT